MAERHGRNSRLIINGFVTKMATMEMSKTVDKVEVTAFGDSNKRVVVGLPDLTLTFSGFWDDASDALFDAADAGNPVNVYAYPDAANAPTQYWYGAAYIEASWSSGVSAAVALSGSAVASGNWGRLGLP
jgi:hypothetical protein